MGINKKNNMKYLVFRTSNDYSYMFPYSSLKHIRHGIDTQGITGIGQVVSDQVDMYFEHTNEKVKIEISVKSGKRKTVMQNLMTAVSKSNSDIIIVADDKSNEYVTNDIQSIAIETT